MLLVVLLLALAAPSAAAPWRWPLHGTVQTPFHVKPNPFAPGQHRGIDIAAAAGTAVRSACPGRVTFAGRIPGRAHVVTVACGPLVATYLELGRVVVEEGAPVAAGAPIGTVASSHLQLGARRAGARHAYIDPLTLLAADPSPLRIATLPRRGPEPRAPVPRLVRPLAPVPRPQPAPADRRDRTPVAAWLGLALFTAGTPLGALAHRRHRRRRALEPSSPPSTMRHEGS
jgi:peptidase M23-like protein